MKNNDFSALRYIAYVGQLGLSAILPIIFCTWVAVWLKNRFLLPDFIVLIGIGLGIGGACVSFLRFARLAQRSAQNDEENHDKSKK